MPEEKKEPELEVKIEVWQDGEFVVRGSGLSWSSAEDEFYKLQRFYENWEAKRLQRLEDEAEERRQEEKEREEGEGWKQL